MNIQDDQAALESVKDKSRAVYMKTWREFRDFFDNNISSEFDERMPTESEFLAFFRDLRVNKKRASSSMWTVFSMINSTCKAKYGLNLQTFPRITTLLKSYDIDIKKKALTFTSEDIEQFINNSALVGPYWMVRKVTVIFAFFGGLRHTEAMDLELEKFSTSPEGVYVVHRRAKQRSDKQSSRFLIPRGSGSTDYAALVESYLSQIKDDLGKYTGNSFVYHREIKSIRGFSLLFSCEIEICSPFKKL